MKKQFNALSLQNKITVIVVVAHVLLLIGFQSGLLRVRSASNLGDTVEANLLDSTPPRAQEKPKPEKPKPVEKPQPAIKTITTTTAALTPEPATPAPTPPQNSGASGEPRTVSMSQAQCSVPEPVYPSLSRRMGEEGKALVRLYINESGAVEKVALAQSSGLPRLDQAALDAGQKARCRPFMESGKAIKVTAIQPYIFRLE